MSDLRFDHLTPIPSRDGPDDALRAAQRRDRQMRQSEQRRQQLLDVAFELFEQAGRQGFQMRSLAQRAGYTAGALYAYFDGKDAILGALRDRVLLQVQSQVQQVKTGGYLRRSLGWWEWFAQDIFRLRLLLGVDDPPTEMSDAGAGASSLMERLVQATQACETELLALGLDTDGARQLHAEGLAWGVGLLLLQTAGGQPSREAFVSGLERRLLSFREGLPTDTTDASAAFRQGDLFGA